MFTAPESDFPALSNIERIEHTILLLSASDIVLIFSSIELQSYGLHWLSTLYTNSELSILSRSYVYILGG